MTSSFTFGAFAKVVADVANDQGKSAVEEGIKASGATYSLAGDIKAKALDSLDVTELLMSLEEELQKLPGLENLKLEGDEVDNANNIGDIYLFVCKQVGLTPQMTAVA